MSAAPPTRIAREALYREYMEFFERAERTRRWHLEDDIPWEKLDRHANTEEMAICLETFCGVELYVPDYTANGFLINREFFGHAWFQACWGYEESKHALVFREYLIRSGLRTAQQYGDYEDQILSKTWHLPYATRRQMVCYGVLQEMATYLIYRAQKVRYRDLQNEVLETVFHLVARDESAHTGFYRNVLRLELSSDYEGTLEDLAKVTSSFRMPGVELVPEYAKRLGVEGVGISPQKFLQEGVFPLLRALKVKRSDLARAFKRGKSTDEATDQSFLREAEQHEIDRRSADETRERDTQ
jgi:acyl-[acyl-carrier-protein] desaturase